MKERPIIFNTAMVKAILAGRKTVTRRPVKPQPPDDSIVCYDSIDYYRGEGWFFQYAEKIAFGLSMNKKHYLANNGKCPFGQIGDRFYVREIWQEVVAFYGESMDTLYAADYNENEYEALKPWKPSIHMPKWASRIWLEITDVKVERVQKIDLIGCKKEGMEIDLKHQHPREHFIDLWDSIYKNWSSNPWVWVIEFKRVER